MALSKEQHRPQIHFSPPAHWMNDPNGMVYLNNRYHLFYQYYPDSTRESEFGKDVGAHGGVWECPDLFPLKYNGQVVWVLFVSINPGGPNGGSATQYFTGRFDGRSFVAYDTITRWLDYGPDDYAGVTWSNTGERKIFLGWMSNWEYAQSVPTIRWRSAMTVPRDLGLQKINEQYFVTSQPSEELDILTKKLSSFENIDARNYDVTHANGKLSGPASIELNIDTIENFSITLSNNMKQKVIVGYDKELNLYYIDRRQSGKSDFHKSFASRTTAPRLTNTDSSSIKLIIDKSSVELFADGGLTVMTGIFFPDRDYTDITIQSPDDFHIKRMKYNILKSIY